MLAERVGIRAKHEDADVLPGGLRTQLNGPFLTRVGQACQAGAAALRGRTGLSGVALPLRLGWSGKPAWKDRQGEDKSTKTA